MLCRQLQDAICLWNQFTDNGIISFHEPRKDDGQIRRVKWLLSKLGKIRNSKIKY